MALNSQRIPVGQPTHEVALTDAALVAASRLLPPGSGRSLHLAEEASFPNGRPDVVIITASRQAVSAMRRNGRRLDTFSEAQVLATTIEPARAHGLSRDHARSLLRRLAERGWTPQTASQASRLVDDSLLIEAKVRDWRRGVSQLARNRRLVHRAALLLPQTATPAVGTRVLEAEGVGLFSIDLTDSAVQVVDPPPRAEPSTAGRLWLAELAIRSVDGVRSDALR